MKKFCIAVIFLMFLALLVTLSVCKTSAILQIYRNKFWHNLKWPKYLLRGDMETLRLYMHCILSLSRNIAIHSAAKNGGSSRSISAGNWAGDSNNCMHMAFKLVIVVVVNVHRKIWCGPWCFQGMSEAKVIV